MKTLLMALVAASTLMFAAPAETEARHWRYAWGPRPVYRAAYRPYYAPYPPYYRQVYRPYGYGYWAEPGYPVGVYY